MSRVVAIFFLALAVSTSLFAQAGNARLSGFIQDPLKAFVSGARVTATNTDTGQHFATTTNRGGSYNLSSLPVGSYRLEIEKTGFETVVKEGLFLHTQDVVELNFKLVVGSVSNTVTVTSQANNINTTDASVGTVIDQKFVEGIPMNGRSFQTLVLLSPGTVTNTPQIGSGTPPGNDQGEYSVNGMRSDSNTFSVDGGSASNAPSVASAAGSAGMLSSSTMLGTTQAMLSVDAMQEFRISTSTYSAEYGRQPGAQVSFRSKSGTNVYHGTAYEYLRNVIFDANNWFNTYSTPAIPTPAEHQNDFGGTLGGPLSIPHVYSGRDRAFFFFAYEGLRLDNPQAASIYYVPSNGTFNTATYSNPDYMNIRQYAPAILQPVLNTFPLPNCSTAIDPQCVDYGMGSSPYLHSPTTKGIINSITARVDYQLLASMRLFARYNDAISSAIGDAPAGPYVNGNNGRNRVYMLGVDNTFGSNVSNELRLQYSPALLHATAYPTSSGGAVPMNFNTMEGLPPVGGEFKLSLELTPTTNTYQQSYGSKQNQPNATDSVTWAHGRHLFKAGVNYRQTTAYYGDGVLSRGPYTTNTFSSAANLLNDQASIHAVNYLREDPTTKDLGLFIQDEWRVSPRMTLSMGLRWDLTPPPSVSGAPMITYTGDINNPATLGLSALGAPLYKTTYTDFAPRFGVAYTIYDQPGRELVLRAGGGLFYDTIALNQTFGAGFGVGSTQGKNYNTANDFPAVASQILLPLTLPPAPPYAFEYYPNNQIVPPSAIQWNVSLEQAFGSKQSVTLGYVASNGRKLATFLEYSISKLNPNFSNLYLYTNGPGSDYNSLQAKYQRQLSHGLQAIASYTWSHAIDWASTEDYSAAYPLQRGNSNFDIRHNLTAAIVYDVPTSYVNRFERALLGYWNADLWFVARTAFPFEPVGPAITDPITGDVINSELNYNGSPNPYVYRQGIPGGKQINPANFSVTTSQYGIGNAPRNFLRGFGEIQANVAIQRSFPIYKATQLIFRGEAFNIANHPNFGAVNTTCGVTTLGATCNSAVMGQATGTLSSSLGGLSSLYQQGGPRSLQFMLKLQF